MLRSDTSGLTVPVSKKELPKVDHAEPTSTWGSTPASNKRKGSPGKAATAGILHYTVT